METLLIPGLGKREEVLAYQKEKGQMEYREGERSRTNSYSVPSAC